MVPCRHYFLLSMDEPMLKRLYIGQKYLLLEDGLWRNKRLD